LFARLGGHQNRGMPLGNLTSQFFANVYLNELDHYVKEVLQIKYYIRYVDDFVILSNSREELQSYRDLTGLFLKDVLNIELHPEKTKIEQLDCGTGFLGFRIFHHHKLIKKSNLRKFKNKMRKLCLRYDNKDIDYDKIYDSIEGWIAYSNKGDNHNMQNKILRPLEQKFGGEISTKEYNRYLKTHKPKKHD
jgi:RNA-directed DNA polymerase